MFRQKLLALEPRPAIIIHPDHLAARALADLADEIFKSVDTEVPAFPHNDLKLMAELSDEDEKLRTAIESLDGSEASLFLDDAFITGTRVTSYQKTSEISAFPAPITISSLSHDPKRIEFGTISNARSFVRRLLSRWTMVVARCKTCSTLSKSWSCRIGRKTGVLGVRKGSSLNECARRNTRNH